MPVSSPFNFLILFVYYLSVFLLIWIFLPFSAIPLQDCFHSISLVSLPSFLSAFICLPLFTSFLCLKTRKLSPTSRYILRFSPRIFFTRIWPNWPRSAWSILFLSVSLFGFSLHLSASNRYLFKPSAEFTHCLCRLAAHIGLQFCAEKFEVKEEKPIILMHYCISSTSCFWLISQWLSFTSPHFKQRNVRAAQISAGFLPAGMSEGWRSWVERQSRKDLFGCLFSANQCQGNGAMHSHTPLNSFCLSARGQDSNIKSNSLWEERRDKANERRTKTLGRSFRCSPSGQNHQIVPLFHRIQKIYFTSLFLQVQFIILPGRS